MGALKKDVFQLIAESEKASPIIKESETFFCNGCLQKVTEITHANGYKWKWGCNCIAIQRGKESQYKNDRIKHYRYYRASLEFIPKKLQTVTFDSYIPQNNLGETAKRICQRFADNYSKDNAQSLFLYGGFGLGKTHLSMCILNQLKDKYKVMFIDVNKLLSNIRLTWNKNNKLSSTNYQERIMELIKTADLVVFDDIGAESQSSMDKSIINNLVNSRMGKHSIFTSNLTNKELSKDKGFERNFSRMMESCTPIGFEGEDFRRKGKFANNPYQLPYDLSNPPF